MATPSTKKAFGTGTFLNRGSGSETLACEGAIVTIAAVIVCASVCASVELCLSAIAFTIAVRARRELFGLLKSHVLHVEEKPPCVRVLHFPVRCGARDP